MLEEKKHYSVLLVNAAEERVDNFTIFYLIT